MRRAWRLCICLQQAHDKQTLLQCDTPCNTARQIKLLSEILWIKPLTGCPIFKGLKHFPACGINDLHRTTHDDPTACDRSQR